MNDYEQLMFAVQGHVAFNLLFSACELRLFDVLETKESLILEELATTLDIPTYSAKILLRGLVSIGLLDLNDNKFHLNDISRKYLCASSPHNITKVLLWQKHIVYIGLQNLTESLRLGTNKGLIHFPGKGETLYQRLQEDSFREQAFQESMEALSSISNQILAEAFAAESESIVADIGGGNGTNLIQLCQKYPEMKGIVVDNESVCNMAKANIDKYGMSTRISTYTANFLSDKLPNYVDAFLYSHIFTIYSFDKNVEILNRTYDALSPGGRVYIFNMAANDDSVSPIGCTLGSVYFLAIATGEGMLYSISDYKQMIAKSKFAQGEFITGLELDHILIKLKK